MRCLGKIAVCLASGLVLNAGALADDAVLPNNPYAPIVVRNVFGLNPPTPIDASQSADPPPKITPNGIMSIFGQLQVLFKVATPAKPGQPAKEDSYILSEGQRQDEIEVIQIDEKDSLVTFNNHGTVQELALAKASPPPVNTIVAPPGRPNPRSPNVDHNGRIPTRFGGRSGAAQNHVVSAGPPSPTPQSQAAMTPDEQTILIEANRLLYQKQVDEGSYPPLPPTGLTPPDATAHEGAPLIAK
ncbi:MAG: hypothetical protein ABSF60_14900 [Verrucomicrobiota bacterium]